MFPGMAPDVTPGMTPDWIFVMISVVIGVITPNVDWSKHSHARTAQLRNSGGL